MLEVVKRGAEEEEGHNNYYNWEVGKAMLVDLCICICVCE